MLNADYARKQIDDYFQKVSSDLDNCLNIKEMMSVPLKSKAFAIS